MTGRTPPRDGSQLSVSFGVGLAVLALPFAGRVRSQVWMRGAGASESEMLEEMRLRWRLRQWERAARVEEEGTARAIENAKARQDFAEIEEIAGGSSAGVLRYKRREAMSKYLIIQAERWFIPLPDVNDERMWTKRIEDDVETLVLTHAGINEVRGLLEAKLKVRRERVLMWTAVIGAITAVLSTLLYKAAK
jgi:hypothetical protein